MKRSRREVQGGPGSRHMSALVYRGGTLAVETIRSRRLDPTTSWCGWRPAGFVRRTSKIRRDLLPPPRIYGHETAGVVARVGGSVRASAQGTPSSSPTMSPAWIATSAGVGRSPNAPAIEQLESPRIRTGGGGFSEDVCVKRGCLPG